jgi:hypothetical protein
MKFKLQCKKIIDLPIPSVDLYYKLMHYVDEKEKLNGIIDWLGSGEFENRAYIQPEDLPRAEMYLNHWLREQRSKEEYSPPVIATEAGENELYKTVYHEMKLVYDYSGIDFMRLRKLDVLTFWRYFRDAIIYRSKQSEQGREYLEKAHNSVQTKPDRAAIAELIRMQ